MVSLTTVRKAAYGVMLAMSVVGHFMYTESTVYSVAYHSSSNYAVLILAMMLMMLSSVETTILPARFRLPARTLATFFYTLYTPGLVCEIHDMIKAQDNVPSTSRMNTVIAGGIFMFIPLYTMFVIAYLPTQVPSFNTQNGVMSLVLRLVQIFGATLLIIGQFIQWSTTDLCAYQTTYTFLRPDEFIIVGVVVLLSVIGGSDSEAYDIALTRVATYVVVLVPFNPFAPNTTDEGKKMLGSLWMAYIGSILIVGAAMLASKFVPQAWTNPNANGGVVGTDRVDGASLGARVMTKVRSPIMIALVVMFALAFVGSIMAWVRLPTPGNNVTPTLAMKDMNYFAGLTMFLVVAEMVAFVFDIWGMHIMIFLISLVLNTAVVNVYMNTPASDGTTGEGVLRGGLYLLSWVTLLFPFVVPVLRSSSVVQENASKPIDQMFSLSDPAARRGLIIGVLALILWYFGGYLFQNNVYDQTIMIAGTMVAGHLFKDADLLRVVYFAMTLNVAVFMPFAKGLFDAAPSALTLLVFVVGWVFFGLYVSTFPSPKVAADGADASAGVAAFNGISTFVTLNGGTVTYESVDVNNVAVPAREQASKPLIDAKHPVEGVDSPRSEGYGSA